MSILSDRYKIPESTIKNMVQDGVLSSKYECWETVRKLRAEGKSIIEIGDACKIEKRTVYDILKKFK